MMKFIKNMLGLILAMLVIPVVSVSAAERVEIKCHVELLGGKDSVYFAVINHHDLNREARNLVGKRVSLPNFRQKQKIFKVNQCVMLNDQFTKGRAQKKDAQTPR